MSETRAARAKYLIGLAGHERDLRFLAGFCNDHPFSVVRHRQHGYLLRAPGILSFERPLGASRMVPHLLGALNGLARCQSHDFRPVTKNGLYKVEADGSATPIPQIRDFDARPPAPRPRPFGDMQELVRFALTDAKAERVLKLLAYEGDRWFALWWVYELVLEDAAEAKSDRENTAHELGWADKRELVAFRRTANWHEIEGARHAVPEKPGQNRPRFLMEPLDAHRFVSTLVLRWLRHRIDRQQSRCDVGGG